jgi:hypothetical protein
MRGDILSKASHAGTKYKKYMVGRTNYVIYEIYLKLLAFIIGPLSFRSLELALEEVSMGSEGMLFSKS